LRRLAASEKLLVSTTFANIASEFRSIIVFSLFSVPRSFAGYEASPRWHWLRIRGQMFARPPDDTGSLANDEATEPNHRSSKQVLRGELWGEITSFTASAKNVHRPKGSNMI
jgi:hypothetical protein